MSEHAYDISYLLESEPARTVAPDLRIARAPSPAPAPPSLAAVKEALARELLQAAAVHEAMIEQYLRMTEVGYRDSYEL